MSDPVDPNMGVTTGRTVLGAPTLTVNPPAKTKKPEEKPAKGKRNNEIDQDHD